MWRDRFIIIYHSGLSKLSEPVPIVALLRNDRLLGVAVVPLFDLVQVAEIQYIAP